MGFGRDWRKAVRTSSRDQGHEVAMADLKRMGDEETGDMNVFTQDWWFISHV